MGTEMAGLAVVFRPQPGSFVVHVSFSQSTGHPITKGPTTLGSPAIEPHINTSNPDLPTFTREDVVAWIGKNSVWRMPALEPPTIAKIVFTTDSEVKRVLGESTGLPETAPVCYVDLHGRFGAPHPPGAVSRVFKRVWAVFDGRTGNFLMAVGSVD